jgi:replicative DNA helicase
LVGNACSLSMPYIQDGKIIKRDNLVSVLFIATEMDPDEIQTLILAYVSGINEEKILTNRLTAEEERTLEVAIKIVEEYGSNFKIEKISDPSISGLRSKLTRYVLTDHYRYIFYDYIFTSPALNMEFSKTGLREDVVLMMLSNTLKEVASDYGVFVYTGTQVSRGWEKAQFRNENYIAGSKAIADKIDFGVIGIKLTEDDKEKIEPLLLADGIDGKPNIVLDVYKNRRGRIVNAKIFVYFDYGTCRRKDLIMTDTNFDKWNMGLGRVEYSYKIQDLLDVKTDE